MCVLYAHMYICMGVCNAPHASTDAHMVCTCRHMQDTHKYPATYEHTCKMYVRM